ncbi:MAG: aldo/keto reductase [Anaerolineaceae bacterium]|nr:aldo/keto reductase [Anaerolineaceae bacterium]
MITKQLFGRSNHLSSRLIFGAYALSDSTQAEADRTLDILLAHGVNHIDVAPMYGKAEKLVGSWMKYHRNEFFLATKTRSRDFDRAWINLQKSLDLLQVDSIDLWQMHGLTNPVGWEKAMGSGGALEAFIKAREQGLVKNLGVTGHGSKVPAVHKRSLERFDFDSVLLPYNYCQMQNSRYANDFNDLYEICLNRNVAFQTIKAIARRAWDNRPKTHNTCFYEPLTNPQAIAKSIYWALRMQNTFVISAGDLELLPFIIEAADSYEETPSDEEMQSLMEEFDIQPIFTY